MVSINVNRKVTDLYERHTLLDCKNATRNLGASQWVVQSTQDIAEAIGVPVAAGPYYNHVITDENNIHTGALLIEDGHILIHTHPKRGLIFVDVLSRTPFKSDCVMAVLRNHFGGKIACLVTDIDHEAKV